ncbi:uncharacterized protein [Epargyreus clarus]|uniref:uncharacterized protein n=1 Tax=Epargyreus clarus TaxID=520877 RepID=UPI003C2E4825
MEVIRYKYIFILVVTFDVVSSINKNGTSIEKSHNCPFTRIIEDIFKINNKTSDSIYVNDDDRTKLFLNSIKNFTSTENNTSKLIQEELVNDIIASIKRIKENITAEESAKESSLNEAIILNVPKRNKTMHNNNNRKVVNQIKSGIEDRIDVHKPKNVTTKIKITKRDDAMQLDNTKNIKNDMNKSEYVEILTVEPNNTTINNSSSNKILEVLKQIMPMLNSSINKELHSVTIIERNQNKNQTFSETKNISTVVVKYCDKSNVTLSNNSSNIKREVNDTLGYDDFQIETDNTDYNNASLEKKMDSNLSTNGHQNILEAAEYGMQKMHELYTVLEPKLYSMGLWLDDKNPARYVAAFNAPSEDIAKYSRYGYATMQAAAKLKQLTGVEDDDGLESRTEEAVFPAATALRQSPLLDECPLKGPPKCPPASKR